MLRLKVYKLLKQKSFLRTNKCYVKFSWTWNLIKGQKLFNKIARNRLKDEMKWSQEEWKAEDNSLIETQNAGDSTEISPDDDKSRGHAGCRRNGNSAICRNLFMRSARAGIMQPPSRLVRLHSRSLPLARSRACVRRPSACLNHGAAPLISSCCLSRQRSLSLCCSQAFFLNQQSPLPLLLRLVH